MTVETRTTLEPKDIQTLELECPNCGAKTIYPIQRCSSPETRCRVCDPDKQLLVQGDPIYRDMINLCAIITRLASLKTGFKIRLGVAGTFMATNAE